MSGLRPDLSLRTMATSSEDEASDGCDDVIMSSGIGQGVVSDLLRSFHYPLSVLEGNSDITVDKDRSDYVPTPALEEADEILQSTGRVILCGPPGSGKTTLAYALSRRSREQGFHVYTLERLELWRSRIGGRERSIVLLDGNFGKIFLDSKQHGQWNRLIDTILEQLKLGVCRLVITAYPHVLRELQRLENNHKSPIRDDNAIVHLTGTFPLLVKVNLLIFHLDDFGLEPDRLFYIMDEVLERDVSGPVFPWCCDYMVNHWNSSDHPTAIFSVPAEAHVQLLKEMVLNKTHGRFFAAVLALAMKGVCHFLHHLSEAEPHLEDLGFRQIDDDTLSIYADILQDSVLLEGGFSSRVLYEAAGLALGRFFRLPTLLRVCDIPFLVQYINATATSQAVSDKQPFKLCVTVGSVASCSMDPKRCADDCRALVERIYTEITQGNLQDIYQHPCLQCSEFLQELDSYCSKSSKMDQLLNAVDPVHHLPLVYWSIFHSSPNLTHWCLSKAKKVSRPLAPVLIACSLLDHLTQSSECRLPSSLQERLSQEDFKHLGQVMTFPLPGADHHFTDVGQNQTELIAGTWIYQEKLLYLFNSSLPITSDIVILLMNGNGLELKVKDRHHWYLVFRLLSDRYMDQTDKDGNSLLHIAVESGESAAVRLCLRSGGMMTQPNKYGVTPYQLAHKTRALASRPRLGDPFSGNNITISRTDLQLLLLQVGVHYRDETGWTGLLLACRRGWEDLAELCIELGADVNVVATRPYRDNSVSSVYEEHRIRRSTPLHQACNNGMERTVGLLLRSQAGVSVRTNTGDTALHFACLCSSPTASKTITWDLLQAGADVNARNKFGDAPLHYAARNGYCNTVDLLVRHGSDVNLQCELGDTPLLSAVRLGHDRTAKLLHHFGADINKGNNQGGTPRLCPTTRGCVGTAEIRHSACVNARNDMGNTPLLLAVRNGHLRTVEMLLRHGADVHTQNKDGATPLLLAGQYHHLHIQILLERHQLRAHSSQSRKKGF